MSFSAFGSFLHKLIFQRSKNQLKNLPFIFTPSQLFHLKTPAETRLNQTVMK
jgi:hypothetical protein